MRVLLQRVSQVELKIREKTYSQIGQGLLVLLGIEDEDTQEDIDYLVRKVCNLRIFEDSEGKMNLSVGDINGEIMVVSQFTLYANTNKGNRPSFIKAAKPDIAIPLYESFLKSIGLANKKEIKTGVFGAEMQINLINDGPVTIWMDSRNRD